MSRSQTFATVSDCRCFSTELYWLQVKFELVNNPAIKTIIKILMAIFLRNGKAFHRLEALLIQLGSTGTSTAVPWYKSHGPVSRYKLENYSLSLAYTENLKIPARFVWGAYRSRYVICGWLKAGIHVLFTLSSHANIWLEKITKFIIISCQGAVLARANDIAFCEVDQRSNLLEPKVTNKVL